MLLRSHAARAQRDAHGVCAGGRGDELNVMSDEADLARHAEVRRPGPSQTQCAIVGRGSVVKFGAQEQIAAPPEIDVLAALDGRIGRNPEARDRDAFQGTYFSA
jgi:hypothetical protein